MIPRIRFGWIPIECATPPRPDRYRAFGPDDTAHTARPTREIVG